MRAALGDSALVEDEDRGRCSGHQQVVGDDDGRAPSHESAERADPDLLNGSRRLRIAKGSGRTVPEVNQLLGQFKQMQKLMKSAGKPGMRLPFGRGL